jgi:hypothetical protein
MTVKYNFITGGCLEKCTGTGRINIRNVRVFNLLLK